MEYAVLRKGNLYNPLTKQIDKLLIDSDQYDLEVIIDGKPKYYRVRYEDSFFEAREGQPKKFIIHKYNNSPILPEEACSFTRTRLFRQRFQDKKLFPEEMVRTNNAYRDAYYTFLVRKRGKGSINNSRRVYSFSLPALGVREKFDVDHYDIDIELANNRYYVVFITEKVNKYGFQRREPLYMIYEKKDFQKMREDINLAVLGIAAKEDYPLELLQYVYLAAGGDYKLISQFFNIIDSAKSIEEALENPFIKKMISSNAEVKTELVKYLNGEQDDINYSYKKKQ